MDPLPQRPDPGACVGLQVGVIGPHIPEVVCRCGRSVPVARTRISQAAARLSTPRCVQPCALREFTLRQPFPGHRDCLSTLRARRLVATAAAARGGNDHGQRLCVESNGVIGGRRASALQLLLQKVVNAERGQTFAQSISDGTNCAMAGRFRKKRLKPLSFRLASASAS